MLHDAPVLVGERVRLRPYEPRDAAVRARFGRTRDIVRGFGGNLAADGPLSVDTAAKELAHRFAPGPHWIIADGDDQFLGVVRLAPIDLVNRSANFAIGLFDPARLGRGLGSDATILALSYAFDVLDLHRVSLTVLAENARAVACYHNCGFEIEGRLRQTLWRDDRWYDDLVMAILNPNHG